MWTLGSSLIKKYSSRLHGQPRVLLNYTVCLQSRSVSVARLTTLVCQSDWIPRSSLVNSKMVTLVIVINSSALSGHCVSQSLRYSLYLCYGVKRLALPVFKQCLSLWVVHTKSCVYCWKTFMSVVILEQTLLEVLLLPKMLEEEYIYQRSVQHHHGVLHVNFVKSAWHHWVAIV